jgi:UDP-3-O-[3-hydroxymyristoyl] glucosamine N-acyltransferase
MKTLAEIASHVGGSLHGDGSVQIERIVHPSLAENHSDLALVLSPNAIRLLDKAKVFNVVLPAGSEDVAVPNRIVVDRPRLVLAKLTQLFERPVHIPTGVHPTAVVDPTAKIGREVSIGPNCSIGPNSKIGDRSRLVANVTVGAEVEVGRDALIHAGTCIGDRSKIGDRVIIQPNVTIGGDGFAFVTPETGSVESVRATGEVRYFNTDLVRIFSLGNVVIEDDVEIGAGTCIDRGTLGETRIGQGSKLDNLVQVGHNVTIGKNCLIVSQVGLGGSSTVGDRAVVGGQAGLPDHLTIGDDAVVHAQAGITSHVAERAVVIGSPAQPKRDFLEREVYLKRLPSLSKQLKELKQQIAALADRLNT